jgi:hypothetical protein
MTKKLALVLILLGGSPQVPTYPTLLQSGFSIYCPEWYPESDE